MCVYTQLRLLLVLTPLRTNWALDEVPPAPTPALQALLSHLPPSSSFPLSSHHKTQTNCVPGPCSQPLARELAKIPKGSSLRVMSLVLAGGMEAPGLRNMVDFQQLQQVLADRPIVSVTSPV